MRTIEMIKIALIAFVGVALFGCNKDATPQNQPTKAAKAPVVKKNKIQFERSALEDGMGVPFILHVRGPKDLPEKGQFDLVADIQVNATLNVPATIAVQIPDGVNLVSGQQEETLSSLPAGQLQRTFKFEVVEKLQKEQPIKVIVDCKDPGGAFGAHAERAYPPAPRFKGKMPYSDGRIPPPPVNRPRPNMRTR